MAITTRNPHRRGRVIRAVVFALLLGFATTWALAWSFAAWAHTVDGTTKVGAFDGGEYLASFGLTSTWGITQLYWRPVANDGMVRFTSGDEGLPRWSKLRALQGPFASGGQFGAARQTIEVATGWPWRALKSEFHDYPPGTSPPAGKPYATVSGIEMPVGVVKRGALFFVPRALPYRPILPGLIADVMLYGLMWWGLLTLLPSIRRWRRRRSGLCIACGYDLQGDQAGGCPECGWNRAEAASAA